MRIIPYLFHSCFLLGLLATTGNGQLTSGTGILPAVQGVVNGLSSGAVSSPPSGAPSLNDALSNILGPILGGNSNGGNSSVCGPLNGTF